MYRVSRTIHRESEEQGPSQGFLRGRAGSKAGAAIGHDDRRSEARYACDCRARIASSDRAISTAGRIVNISAKGAKVEVMFPRHGPNTIFLVDEASSEIFECEVRWRSGFYIGVRFLDVLGPADGASSWPGKRFRSAPARIRSLNSTSRPKRPSTPGRGLADCSSAPRRKRATRPRLKAPSRTPDRAPAPLLQTRDDGESLDLAGLIGLQERVIILEGNATEQVAVRPQHVGMGEQTGAPELFAVADRFQTQRLDPIKGLFAQAQFVNVWRRRAFGANVNVVGVVN